MSGINTITTTSFITSTVMPPISVLIKLCKDEGRFIVSDYVGLRYGDGATPAEALAAWAEQVDDLLTMTEPTAPPLSDEIAAYRSALA